MDHASRIRNLTVLAYNRPLIALVLIVVILVVARITLTRNRLSASSVLT